MKPRIQCFSCSSVILGLLACLSMQGIAEAELPLLAYRKMQREAPDVITIHVLCVTTTLPVQSPNRDIHCVVTARVNAVHKSQSNLKPGAVIEIRYVHSIHPPLPGASEIPILQPGQTCPAFLEHGPHQFYKTAAGAYSFETLPAERKPKHNDA